VDLHGEATGDGRGAIAHGLEALEKLRGPPSRRAQHPGDPQELRGRLYLAHGSRVPGQLRVGGEEGDALADGLGQQQTVERIFVQRG